MKTDTQPIILQPAAEVDYPEIVRLVNAAYRGTGPSASWNYEAELIEGQRLTEPQLREDLAKTPRARLLVFKDPSDGSLLGTVWLEMRENNVCYLGLLTVRPDLQDRKLGRTVLAAAEEFARSNNVERMRMSVIQARQTLIAWYQRRGYKLTGETIPFPYGEERFGKPLRNDLHFVILEKALVS